MEISDDEEEQLAAEEVHLERADPQECGEFVGDIYLYLHQSQRKYQPSDFLQIQTDINSNMTGILMDWLVEVAEEYHLGNETLHLAKHYIDRFLSIYKVTRARLQLVGVAAMLVAAKFEEIFPPTVDDFVYISDNTFSRAQVIEMESLVLNSLKFDLTNPTAVEFLTRYSAQTRVDVVVQTLAKFLMELTLMDYSMLVFLPSHVALCSLALAAHAQQAGPSVVRALQQLVAPDEREALGACMTSVYKLWVAAPRNKLQAVRLKYDRAKHYKVASVPPPTSLPLF